MRPQRIKDEETAWAIVYANTHRKKRPDDLLLVAEAFEFLIKIHDLKIVAEKADLSTEMVRQFLTVLKLPQKVQILIRERKIDSVDITKEIAALGDASKQIEAAEAIVNSTSKDVRDIKRLIKEKGTQAEDAKKIILDAKGFRVFVMDFDDEVSRALVKYAKMMKLPPAELVKKIVMDWLEEKTKEKK
ncbi:hypothetical protein JXM67_10165 [candidate division WOR-3 bacterium]|nr:hypothetical protein [candidate division WOR-3 bacterium]